jgi:hypothetical protein
MRGSNHPLSDVKAFMGHADIAMTMIYVHHVPQHDAAHRLGAVLRRERNRRDEPVRRFGLVGWSSERPPVGAPGGLDGGAYGAWPAWTYVRAPRNFAVAGVAARRNAQASATLFADPQARRNLMDDSTLGTWLEAVEPGTTLNRVWMLIGGLQQLTAWPEDTLYSHVGCPGLTTLPREGSPRTLHCLAYLGWVTELCNRVDPSLEQVRARREVVVSAFELCDGADGPVLERVDRCRRAMNAAPRGDLSGRTLLWLGEIQAGFAQAARQLPDGRARVEQDSFDQQTPQLRVGHLHPRRLTVLLTEQDPRIIQRELGATVALRMHDHLRDCPRCQETAAELDLRWDRAGPLASAAA